jgi:uncharacterized protein
MKKISLVAGLVIASIIGQSQLLYSIQKTGSTEISYLYGTIHLGDSVLLSWDDNFLDAFYSCDVQVGELDFINKNLSSEVGSLSDIITEMSTYDSTSAPQDTIQKIKEILTIEFDSSTADEIINLNPFWGMTMTEKLRSIKNANETDTIPEETEFSNDMFYSTPIDMQLQIMADQFGMQVMGLETMESQLKPVQFLSSTMTWTMFHDYLIDKDKTSKDRVDTSFDNLKAIYLKQDIQQYYQILEESEMPAEFMRLIFTQRNEQMLLGMQSMMSDQRKYFFAVGAGHLVGPEGLIEMLKTSGYTITPVSFTFTKM